MNEIPMEIDTLVVGAGQAGVAMSEHLSRLGIEHLVLEKSRIAEAWRSGRWNSLVANGPAWHDRFPGLEFDVPPNSFASKEEVAEYFERYAQQIGAPIRTGVEVKRVTRNVGRSGFKVETSQGTVLADRVVVATGPFQKPVIPPIAPTDRSRYQIHSAQYYAPDQLPAGEVLVIGAGSSGVQIAEELQIAGKKVYLSVGPHERPPRTYRDRDFCWWLGVLGLWDSESVQPGREHVTIAVSGARGGATIDFRRLARSGMTLVGQTEAFDRGIVKFKSDLAVNLQRGDDNYLSLLDAADAYVERNGIELPLDPLARVRVADADCISRPLLELDLEKANVTSIIWATGYSSDYGWLQVDTLHADGKPRHQRGVGAEPGIYFVGLPWLSRRGSAFIWGVWHDARHVADHMAIQRQYQRHHADRQRMSNVAASAGSAAETRRVAA